MVKYSILFVLAILSQSSNVLIAQYVEGGHPDSYLLSNAPSWISKIGEPIMEYQLDSLVHWVMDSFRVVEHDNLSVDVYILMAKIGSTLFYWDLIDEKPIYRSFFDLYAKEYYEIVRVLEADVSIGLGHYSCKYDLHISGQLTDSSLYKVYRKN